MIGGVASRGRGIGQWPTTWAGTGREKIARSFPKQRRRGGRDVFSVWRQHRANGSPETAFPSHGHVWEHASRRQRNNPQKNGRACHLVQRIVTTMYPNTPTPHYIYIYINITSQSPPPMCFICYGVTTLSQILPCVVTCPPTAQTSSTIVIREPVYRGDMRGQTGGEQDQNGDKDGYYIHRTSLHPPTSAHLYTKRYP